jgi:hypothetical protein
MSPREVVNPELYADRTVQDWHRATFDADCWAIDLDLMGACKKCAESLYLIEASTNPEKPTRILRRLGERAGVPALLILHKDKMVTGGRVIYWPWHPELRPRLRDEEAIVRVLRSIRREHRCPRMGGMK